jgi:predicted GNAT family N-acyltransferase
VSLEIRFAETAADREAVYRLRYEIYVEELRVFGESSDHDERRLAEEVDDVSRLLLATDDGVPVGTLRVTLGAETAFPEEVVEKYSLDRFLGPVPRESIAVTARFMVHPRRRESAVAFALLEAGARFALEFAPIEATFCDCSPHLVGFYQRLGFRTYRQTYDDPVVAVVVPLVLAVRDVDHLQRVGSPLLALGIDRLGPTPVTRELLARLPERPPVRSVAMHGAYDWADEIPGGDEKRRRALRLFDGLTEPELAAALELSHVIDLMPGDCLIRRGQALRTMYVLLDGELEVRDRDRHVAVAQPGEPVGEIAFLLRRPRTLDVFAGGQGARVLSFHEPVLRSLIESDSRAAAVFLLNLATLMAERTAERR